MFREPEEEKEETASAETLSDRLRTVKVRGDGVVADSATTGDRVGMQCERATSRSMNFDPCAVTAVTDCDLRSEGYYT